MRCPWCGSEPVRITGNHWECGWCGDSGFLRRRSVPTQKPVQVKLSFSLSYHVDLAESWTDLKKALGQLMPDQSLPAQLLGRVLLHSISEGIRSAAAGLEKQKGEELRAFLYHTPDLNLGENIEAVLTQVEKGVLFSEEGALSETECGTFWREIIAAHVEDYYNRDTPDGLYELLDELGSAYAYFEGRKGEEMGRGQDYQNARQDAYDAHCTRISAGRSCWWTTRRRSPTRAPRPWTSCPGRTFWMRCFLGTEQRAWRCGGPCWTSRSLF